MKRLACLFLFFSTVAYNYGQQPCACCTSFHDQFDFWLGSWEVKDTLGNVLGHNRIEPLEDNCILAEHWEGAKGTTGRSFNYFDPFDSTWNQLWLDNAGSILKLKGTATAPNMMVMRSELVPGQRIDFYRNEVSWILNEDGTVTQTWSILDKADQLLTVVFWGIYHRTGDD